MRMDSLLEAAGSCCFPPLPLGAAASVEAGVLPLCRLQATCMVMSVSVSMSVCCPRRLCGRFLQTATSTGRLAMDDPNLQTIPKPVDITVEASQVGLGQVPPPPPPAGPAHPSAPARGWM